MYSELIKLKIYNPKGKSRRYIIGNRSRTEK